MIGRRSRWPAISRWMNRPQTASAAAFKAAGRASSSAFARAANVSSTRLPVAPMAAAFSPSISVWTADNAPLRSEAAERVWGRRKDMNGTLAPLLPLGEGVGQSPTDEGLLIWD